MVLGNDHNVIQHSRPDPRAGSQDLVSLEVAQIVVEAAGSPTAVMTYEPKRFAGYSLQVMDMRPR